MTDTPNNDLPLQSTFRRFLTVEDAEAGKAVPQYVIKDGMATVNPDYRDAPYEEYIRFGYHKGVLEKLKPMGENP